MHGADGLVQVRRTCQHRPIRDASKRSGIRLLQLAEFVINQDIIVLSMPEIAGLPYVVSGLVAAGGLAAALSTADGLLLAIANALSHDVYYKMIDPKASTARRLIVARVLLVGVAIVAAAVAGTRPSGIIQMVAWAFSLAAAGLFAPLVLGIWWKRTTKIGAISGMISGFAVCLFYLVMTRYWPAEFKAMFGTDLWWGIRNISSAVFGLPVAFVVTCVVSLMTPEPSKEMQNFVELDPHAGRRRPGHRLGGHPQPIWSRTPRGVLLFFAHRVRVDRREGIAWVHRISGGATGISTSPTISCRWSSTACSAAFS